MTVSKPYIAAFDGVGFCVVPKGATMDCRSSIMGWTLSFRHPCQLSRGSSNDVSRTISDFTAAESAPSESFKLFSLLPLSWALLNVLHLCDHLRIFGIDGVIWSFLTR